MNGGITDDSEVPEDDLVEDQAADEEVSETDIVMSLDEDNIGDLSVELNVEELVAKLEVTDDTMVRQKREIRHRIEEARAQKEKELDSTYNINLDDD